MAYIDVGQAQLWVEDTGGAGVPVVLLHAAAGHSACWLEQRPLFEAAGFRVVTFDMRGFGKTRCNAGEQTTGSVAGDLERLVDKLSLPRFCLLGTAYGGFGAIEYALDNPDSLHALVISTSFGGLVDAEFAEVRKRHIRPDLMTLPTVERELGASYRLSDPAGVHRFHAMEQGSYKAAGGRQAHRRPTTLSRLEGMKVPTLVIAGDEDLYAPPPVMRLFADRIKGAQFEVLAGVGHSAYWEQPQQWNEMVSQFLAQHS